MKGIVIIVLATVAMAFSASAQQPAPAASHAAGQTNGTGKDQIGLTATQRQMLAWSIAGLGHMQSVPPSFRPAPGMKVSDELTLSRVPHNIEAVAPPASGYQCVMLKDKDLLLVNPQNGTIAEVIHLNRRL